MISLHDMQLTEILKHILQFAVLINLNLNLSMNVSQYSNNKPEDVPTKARLTKLESCFVYKSGSFPLTV